MSLAKISRWAMRAQGRERVSDREIVLQVGNVGPIDDRFSGSSSRFWIDIAVILCERLAENLGIRVSECRDR
jgi:hypothetical protein